MNEYYSGFIDMLTSPALWTGMILGILIAIALEKKQ